MNNDAIILEMLNRIKVLEEKVSNLEKGTSSKGPRTSTDDIRNYIDSEIEQNTQNNGYTTLVARDIHRILKLKNSMPMVCNAMKSCMQNNDEILHQTDSGYSSTLEIKYYKRNN